MTVFTEPRSTGVRWRLRPSLGASVARHVGRTAAVWIGMLSFPALLGMFASLDLAAQQFISEPSDAELALAVRAVVAKDPTAALITLDSEGQPRVRTVDVRPPDDDLVFWISTNPKTRKLDQIRSNAKVTLYFNVDAEGSYVSVMGTAKIHHDLAVKEAIKWRSEAQRKELWPEYPDDYVLIEVRPQWIEVLGEGVEADSETWRPQTLRP